MKQKKVWLLCGIPGSGKSTWVQNKILVDKGIWCSRDNVRLSFLKDGEDYFAHEDIVFENWLLDIQEAINNSNIENIYIDATHLNKKSRNKVLNRLPDTKFELIYVVFKTPLEICLERNELRSGRAHVPKSVIRRMYETFEFPTEGNIIYINEKGEIISE